MNQQQNKLQEVIAYYQSQDTSQQTIVQALREIQTIYGYIPIFARAQLAEVMNLKDSFLQALITRFPSLKGETYQHKIVVCTGPRCIKKGGYQISKAVSKLLNLEPGTVSIDGKIYFITQNCLKKCGTSPNIMIDDKLYSNVTEQKLTSILKEFL